MAQNGQGKKVVITVIFFVLAGTVIAWQMGAFSSSGGGAVSPEQQELQDEAKARQQAIDRGELEEGPPIQADR